MPLSAGVREVVLWGGAAAAHRGLSGLWRDGDRPAGTGGRSCARGDTGTYLVGSVASVVMHVVLSRCFGRGNCCGALCLRARLRAQVSELHPPPALQFCVAIGVLYPNF